tara:strand:- start:48 stop:155 length:108 start_codon:yes stop_codon:yes gene_type:complete
MEQIIPVVEVEEEVKVLLMELQRMIHLEDPVVQEL